MQYNIHYDPNFSVKKAYRELQNIQSFLFFSLIPNTPCSSTVLPIIYIDESTHLIDIESVREIDKYADKRFIVGGIIYDLKQGGHYGGILFDTEKRTYTIFDPSYKNVSNLLRVLERLLKDVIGYESMDIPCPMSFQLETKDRYCSLWSFMIMYMACQKEGDIGKIIDDISKLKLQEKKEEIEGFIRYLYLKAKELGILSYSHKVNEFMLKLYFDKNISSSDRFRIVDDLKHSSNPEKFIDKLKIYNLDTLQGKMSIISASPLINIYIALLKTNDDEILSFMEDLASPMDDNTYRRGVDMLYNKTIGPDDYMPITLYKIISIWYPEVDIFLPILEDMSSLIRLPFSIERMNIYYNKLGEVFSKYNDIPLGEYKIWDFIFEFYMRYYILGTDGIGDKDIMEYRMERYKSLMEENSIDDAWRDRLMRLMLYSPVRYIRMDEFLSSLPLDLDNEIIAQIMAKHSLIPDERDYERVMNLLDPEWNLYG